MISKTSSAFFFTYFYTVFLQCFLCPLSRDVSLPSRVINHAAEIKRQNRFIGRP